MWESGTFEGTMALTTLNVLTVLTALLLCAQGQVLRAGTAYNSRSYSSLLTVTNGERFGSWTWTESCPENYFAIGFSIRVESNQHGGDDTAMNGVRLFCAKDESRSLLYTIESHYGYFGDWTAPQYCPTGFSAPFSSAWSRIRGTSMTRLSTTSASAAAATLRWRALGCPGESTDTGARIVMVASAVWRLRWRGTRGMGTTPHSTTCASSAAKRAHSDDWTVLMWMLSF
uniref:Vitelline membrane outer layer protein 1 homolog n=1 Tax=Neogobius melanostomus TaxID=47308 RepID=A0A8C6UIJ2_9GOBI